MAEEKLCEITADSNIKEITRNTWCTLKPNGKVPSPRVGHTAVYLQNEHKVVLIGGAIPSSMYNEVWLLDLLTLNCERIETVGDFEARYEHSAFLSADGSMTCVFGGAVAAGNKNDLWGLCVRDKKWTELTQDGNLPTPRTYHTTSAVVAGNRMLVFGGGAKGAEAADDENVYQLDLESNKWSILPTKGQTPKPRQGHAIVAVGDKLFLHGGLRGDCLFDDLNILEGDGTWVNVESCEEQPKARAAHGAVHHEGYIYIFGGLGEDRTALNDLWRLHTGTLVWQLVETFGETPSRRLDCTMAVVSLPQAFVAERDREKAETTDQRPFILLHGGINESAKLFDDFHVLSL